MEEKKEQWREKEKGRKEGGREQGTERPEREGGCRKAVAGSGEEVWV